MFSSLQSFLALAGAASILAALCEAPSSWASRSSPFLAAPLHGHGLQGCGEQMDRGLRKQISREMTEKAEDAGRTFLPGFFFSLAGTADYRYTFSKFSAEFLFWNMITESGMATKISFGCVM